MGDGGDSIRSCAPATGELLGEVRAANRDDVRRVVHAAREAQRIWARLPVRDRAARLLRLQKALASRIDELTDVLVQECGKPRHEALLHEITTLLDFIGWCAASAETALAPQAVRAHLMRHRRGELHFVPRGVVGVISPWSFPLLIPMGAVVEALMAGNACVVEVERK